MIEAQFPEVFNALFQPARYKIFHGGRGGAKSWGFARALLIQGLEKPLRILCARETQKSIADSVHRLLKDQIRDLGFSSKYVVQQATILGVNGSEFIFQGLKHNVANIKSVEACDRVWVEEAQSVSKDSWDTLIPTIRKQDSEIWASFNPELETDDTYRRFVLHPPPGAIVRRVTWRDNPWFPAVLRAEKDHMLATDPRSYDNIWEGLCKTSVEGAIYEQELKDCETKGHIRAVAYEYGIPVHTFWDLGFGDLVSIWMVQSTAFEHRVIDYIEGSGKPASYYVEQLQKRPYIWGTDWLPWDGKTKSFATGKSAQEMMQSLGRKVQITPRLSVIDGINAVRTMFPKLYFDGDRCADGLQGLRRYRWNNPANGADPREPFHDAASHPADALRTMGVAIKHPEPPDEQRRASQGAMRPAASWMAT